MKPAERRPFAAQPQPAIDREEISGVHVIASFDHLTHEKSVLQAEERVIALHQSALAAGLNEEQIQYALIYADKKPNPYLVKELSNWRWMVGRPKREVVEPLIEELLKAEKKKEQLMSQARPRQTLRQPEPPTKKSAVTVYPVGDLCVGPREVSHAMGSMATNIPSFRGSTLAISQRGFTVRSEQPFEAEKYRFKWQKVIDQMSREEKLQASAHFNAAYERLNRADFDPKAKAALEKLFGTEDVPTAYALHNYNIERTRANNAQTNDDEVMLRVLDKANELFRKGIPQIKAPKISEEVWQEHLTNLKKKKTEPEIEEEIELDDKDLEEVIDWDARAKQYDKEAASKYEAEAQEKQRKHDASSPWATPEARYAHLDDLNKKWAANEIARKARPAPDGGRARIDKTKQHVDIVPSAEMFASDDEGYEALRALPVTEEESDEDELESLRGKINLPHYDGGYAEVLNEAENAKYPATGRIAALKPDTSVKPAMGKKALNKNADQLMSAIVNEQNDPVAWLMVELSNVHGREKQIEALKYLIQMFDLGPKFKNDLVLLSRGTARDAAKHYDEAIDRFLPTFKQALGHGRLVSPKQIDAFIARIESFAVNKEKSS